MTGPAPSLEAEWAIDEGLNRRYPVYPAYKPSGVDWLGDIPRYWEIKPLKFLSRIRYGLGEPPEYVDDGLPFIRATDIYRGSINTRNIRRVDPTDVPWSRDPRVKTGEIIVVRSGAYTGDSAIITRELSKAGAIAGYDLVLTITNAIPEFIAYSILSKYILHGQIYLAKLRAAQPHLNSEELGNCFAVVPPPDEQEVIVRFLDKKTAEIDALIAVKRELLGLLKEKRQSLITHAVTKGLDPNVKLKPSGIEWLGEVPEHWAVIQLKYAVTFQRGHDLPSDVREMGDIPVVSSAGINSWHNKAVAKGPALVTGRYGTIGTFQLINQDYWPLNTTLYSIDLRDNDVRFLWYMLHNLKEIFLINSIKSAVPGIDRNDLHPTLVAVPKTLEEQRSIADYLDTETEKLDRLSAEVETAITTLQEYRTALISAAVTGKIDVRNEVDHAVF